MKQLFPRLKPGLKSLIQSRKERRHALVGPARLWKMKREFQIRFLRDMALKPEHYVFDIGCGTLRGGLPIIQYLDSGRILALK